MPTGKTGTHEKCLAVIERDGTTFICSRSKEHTSSKQTVRRLHYDVNDETYWFDQLAWEQVEPRRRYRTEIDGKRYSLLRQGRSAPEAGWYLEGGLDGKGHAFMGKRLAEAAEQAAYEIAQHIGPGEKGGRS